MEIIIRKAVESDVQLIVESQMKMAMETENLELDRSTLSKGVMSVLNDNSKAQYYIAEVEIEFAGMLMITLEWSDWRNSWVWWIQSVFVSESYRKHGIFKALYGYIKSQAILREDVAGIRLYVDKTNTRAMKVYDAIGMNGQHYATYEWMK